ncbi:hypothetical protein AAMO2058_000965200 [Amorphochlora amoebiformis]
MRYAVCDCGVCLQQVSSVQINRHRNVKFANGKLVKQITAIACRQRNVVNKTQRYINERKKYSEILRKQRQEKIDRENHAIARRLLNRTSVYNKSTWKRDWNKFTHMSKNISKVDLYRRTEHQRAVGPKPNPSLSPIHHRSPERRNQRGKGFSSLRFSGEGKSQGSGKSHGSGPRGRKARKRPIKVCFTGPPGSDRQEQAELIAQKYGIEYLSVGKLIEREVKRKTTLGEAAKPLVEARQLIPDDLLNDLVIRQLGKISLTKGWLLDGFPRTIGQARSMKAAGFTPDLWVLFELPEEELHNRVIGRRVDPNTGVLYHEQLHPACDPSIERRWITRPQDNEIAVKNFVKSWKEDEKLAKSGPFVDVLLRVSGTTPIEESYLMLCTAVDDAKKSLKTPKLSPKSTAIMPSSSIEERKERAQKLENSKEEQRKIEDVTNELSKALGIVPARDGKGVGESEKKREGKSERVEKSLGGLSTNSKAYFEAACLLERLTEQ